MKALRLVVLLSASFAWAMPASTLAATAAKAHISNKKNDNASKSRLVVRNGYLRAVPRHASRSNAIGEPPQLENGLALRSNSALVLDQENGELIVQKRADAVVPIASISKLMTAMVVLDHHQDLQGVVTVTEEDVDALRGTRSRLSVGSTMTRETALLLALMSSENRAANTLGRHFPGGMSAFVAAMNAKAKKLGMEHTRFQEPTGLSNGNVSTARDLAKLVAAAYYYPKIREATTTAEALVDLGSGRLSEFHNTNALVKDPEWQIGVSKTGFIHEAGRCLVMQARVASRPVVIVLLDSAGKLSRVGDAQRIKKWMES